MAERTVAALGDMAATLTWATGHMSAETRRSTNPAAYAATGFLNDARHTLTDAASDLTTILRRPRQAARAATLTRTGAFAVVLACWWKLAWPAADGWLLAASGAAAASTAVDVAVLVACWGRDRWRTCRHTSARAATARRRSVALDAYGRRGVARADDVYAAASDIIAEVIGHTRTVREELEAPGCEPSAGTGPLQDRHWRIGPLEALTVVADVLPVADAQIRTYRAVLNVRAAAR